MAEPLVAALSGVAILSALTAGAVVTGSVMAVSVTGAGAACCAASRGFEDGRFGLPGVLLAVALVDTVDFAVVVGVVFLEPLAFWAAGCFFFGAAFFKAVALDADLRVFSVAAFLAAIFAEIGRAHV